MAIPEESSWTVLWENSHCFAPGWGKLPAKPRATDLPLQSRREQGMQCMHLQELSHFHMQSAQGENRKSVKGDLWCQLLRSTGERCAGITALLEQWISSSGLCLMEIQTTHKLLKHDTGPLLQEKLQSQEFRAAEHSTHSTANVGIPCGRMHTCSRHHVGRQKSWSVGIVALCWVPVVGIWAPALWNMSL